MNGYAVRDEVHSWVRHAPKLIGCAVPNSGERGVVTGIMNMALRLNDDLKIANARRHMVLAWLFRDLLDKPNASGISAKELTDEMWWALCKYVDAHKDADNGQWHGKDGLEDELYNCWKIMEEYQRELDGQLGFLDIV